MMIIKFLFIILLSFSFANALIINDEQNRYDFDDFKTYYDEDNKKCATMTSTRGE